jgi:hypothetical protein
VRPTPGLVYNSNTYIDVTAFEGSPAYRDSGKQSFLKAYILQWKYDVGYMKVQEKSL